MWCKDYIIIKIYNLRTLYLENYTIYYFFEMANKEMAKLILQ